jgi:hypothetical protein
VAGRFRSIQNCNGLIGNRTLDLPACSIVPQPTTLPRTPVKRAYTRKCVTGTTLYHLMKIFSTQNPTQRKVRKPKKRNIGQKCFIQWKDASTNASKYQTANVTVEHSFFIFGRSRVQISAPRPDILTAVSVVFPSPSR